MQASNSKSAGDGVVQRYKNSICRLEASIREARQANGRLSQQLTSFSRRVAAVSRKIGFATFDDFEIAIADEPRLWRVVSIQAKYENARIEDGCPEIPSHHVSSKEISTGNTASRSSLASLTSFENSSSPGESRLQQELRVLSQKYDALVAAKDNAEHKYKNDYRKWKSFKSWILTKSKHAKTLRAQLAADDPDFGDIFGKPVNNSTLNAGSGRDTLRSSEEAIFPVDANSSSSALPASKNTDATRVSQSTSPEAKKYGGPQGTTCTPASSTSSKPEYSRREIPAHPQETPTTPRKQEGRYVRAADAGEPLNALFAIDASRNNGLNFPYDEVVRDKKRRHNLEVGDCDCCKEYYDTVKPLPCRLAPPTWHDSQRAGGPSIDHGNPDDLQREISSHKKQISRHRHRWSPAKTPPDYWNIGFPTTQEAVDINRRAAEMHANKRKRIEKEANTEGGRYIRLH